MESDLVTLPDGSSLPATPINRERARRLWVSDSASDSVSKVQRELTAEQLMSGRHQRDLQQLRDEYEQRELNQRELHQRQLNNQRELNQRELSDTLTNEREQYQSEYVEYLLIKMGLIPPQLISL